MRTQRKWSAEKIYEEIGIFLNDTVQNEYLETKSFTTIRLYVEDGGRPVQVGNAAACLALWYFNQGAMQIRHGNADGLTLLHTAACARLVQVDIWRRHGASVASQNRVGIARLDQCTFSLATLLTLGTIEDAELSSRFLLRGLREDIFFRPYSAVYPRYVLQMYADWKGEPISLDEYGFRQMESYGDLLKLWNTDDIDALAAAIAAGCDLHIARSRANTQKESFDFDEEYARVFPAEIMCLLRLRELKGLPNPVVNHPLMNLPTAKLLPVQDIPWNPLLLAGYKKACAEFDERMASVAAT